MASRRGAIASKEGRSSGLVCQHSSMRLISASGQSLRARFIAAMSGRSPAACASFMAAVRSWTILPMPDRKSATLCPLSLGSIVAECALPARMRFLKGLSRDTICQTEMAKAYMSEAFVWLAGLSKHSGAMYSGVPPKATAPSSRENPKSPTLQW